MADQQFNPHLTGLLNAVGVTEGFKKPRFTVQGGSNKGDNYSGVITRVKISENHVGGRKSSIDVIVKCQPESEARRLNFGTKELFSNESVFYNVVIPEFISFQKEKGVLHGLAPSHARCLHAGDLLILEDQKYLGYVMKDRREPLDHAHCLLIMRELGRMHAVSFALRDQRPQVFKRIAGTIVETVLAPETPANIKDIFTKPAPRALEKFEEYAKIPMKAKYLNLLKEFTNDLCQKLMDIVNADAAEPYAVINHGDCWTNNILFKYNKNTMAPESACLLDFQLARYASPACDLSYFLFCCTDKAMRDKHYPHLLLEYHSSLGAHLAALGSDVDKMFPWTALQEQMRWFGRYGLALAMLAIPIFMCSTEDVPDFDQISDEATESIADKFLMTPIDSKYCWERVCDVIVDVVDMGYL